MTNGMIALDGQIALRTSTRAKRVDVHLQTVVVDNDF